MSTTIIREAFEKWAITQFAVTREVNGPYADRKVEAAWQAWIALAALAARAVGAEPEGFQLVPDTAIVGLVNLVNEVVASHRDRDSYEYEECELEPCLYCQDANKFISLLSTNSNKESS